MGDQGRKGDRVLENLIEGWDSMDAIYKEKLFNTVSLWSDMDADQREEWLRLGKLLFPFPKLPPDGKK